MAKTYSTIKHALTDLKVDINNAQPRIVAALSLQLAQDAKEQQRAPSSIGVVYANGQRTVSPGTLSESALKTPYDKLKEGIVIWSTPYAIRRYFENNLNPDKTMWDIKTWEANYTTYEEQVANSFESNIF